MIATRKKKYKHLRFDYDDLRLTVEALRVLYHSGEYNYDGDNDALQHVLNRLSTALGAMNYERTTQR